jgi:hypothetical protein
MPASRRQPIATWAGAIGYLRRSGHVQVPGRRVNEVARLLRRRQNASVALLSGELLLPTATSADERDHATRIAVLPGGSPRPVSRQLPSAYATARCRVYRLLHGVERRHRLLPSRPDPSQCNALKRHSVPSAVMIRMSNSSHLPPRGKSLNQEPVAVSTSMSCLPTGLEMRRWSG